MDEIIGRGEFGKVTLVRYISTGVEYAVKKLNIITKKIEYFKKRLQFAHEVQSNPSIIGYIGFSPIDINVNPQPVIITEYMANKSLENLLSRERRNNTPI